MMRAPETDRYAAPATLLTVIGLIALRRILGGAPVFRTEFIIEDFTVVLAVAFGIVPSRFKPLVWHVVHTLYSITLALLAWTLGVQRHTAVLIIALAALFALGAVYSSIRAVRELFKRP